MNRLIDDQLSILNLIMKTNGINLAKDEYDNIIKPILMERYLDGVPKNINYNIIKYPSCGICREKWCDFCTKLYLVYDLNNNLQPSNPILQDIEKIIEGPFSGIYLNHRNIEWISYGTINFGEFFRINNDYKNIDEEVKIYIEHLQSDLPHIKKYYSTIIFGGGYHVYGLRFGLRFYLNWDLLSHTCVFYNINNIIVDNIESLCLRFGDTKSANLLITFDLILSLLFIDKPHHKTINNK